MTDHKNEIKKKAADDEHVADNEASSKKDSNKTIESSKKVKSVEEELKETYDRFLRVSAEFENYKKRSAREMSEFKKFANESLIKELLLIIDNLELAINSSKDEENSNNGLIEGIDMTLKKLLKILGEFGLKQIESLEKPFDPNFHQAVMQEETDKHSQNTVIKELQKGYILNERLLRPAMVVVSKKQQTD
ncbi:MAG: nucleotide exchange factor GrpE [Deltaproteobacteria bacterium]|nr:nucleotide exchange factor GrpE [Deltaproteobacteria bacterium]